MRKTVLYSSTTCVYQKTYVIFTDVESYSAVYARLSLDKFILIVPISDRQIANGIA